VLLALQDADGLKRFLASQSVKDFVSFVLSLNQAVVGELLSVAGNSSTGIAIIAEDPPSLHMGHTCAHPPPSRPRTLTYILKAPVSLCTEHLAQVHHSVIWTSGSGSRQHFLHEALLP